MEKDNAYLKRIVQSMGPETSLCRLQDYVEQMVQVRGFADETPQDCLLLLTEELGELAKEVRKAHTRIKSDTAKDNSADLEGELRDVLMMLLALRRTLDADLMQAFKDKEMINCTRHWR